MHSFVEKRLKVWSIKPTQSVIPTLLPWLEEAMNAMCYMRSETEEGVVLWLNLPTAGIVTSLKRDYFLSVVTGLLASRPANSVCVVLHANRASDGKQTTGAQLTASYRYRLSDSQPHATWFTPNPFKKYYSLNGCIAFFLG